MEGQSRDEEYELIPRSDDVRQRILLYLVACLLACTYTRQ